MQGYRVSKLFVIVCFRGYFILLERLRKISFEISDDLLDLPHVFANEELYSEIFQLHSKFNSLYNTLLEKYLIEAEEKARKEDENASV